MSKIEEIKKMRGKGLTFQEIAKSTNKSYSSVYRAYNNILTENPSPSELKIKDEMYWLKSKLKFINLLAKETNPKDKTERERLLVQRRRRFLSLILLEPRLHKEIVKELDIAGGQLQSFVSTIKDAIHIAIIRLVRKTAKPFGKSRSHSG